MFVRGPVKGAAGGFVFSITLYSPTTLKAKTNQPKNQSMAKKAQLVFVPSPGISHLVAPVEFAKLLVTRNPALSITIFFIKMPHATKTTPYIDSLASSDRIQIITLTPTPSESQSGSFITSVLETQKSRIKEAVSNLTSSSSSPPLAAFVVDMFCTGAIDLARDFGVPAFVFFTSGVAFLGLMLHLHTLRERDNFDTTDLDESDTELAIPSFANPVPARVLPTIVLRKDWESFYLNYVSGLKKADGFIVNSFEELEPHAVHYFSEGDLPVYPVGPILNLNGDEGSESETRQEIIKWLDEQPPQSVVFLCFGSTGTFGGDQVKEMARALEGSGARFLWSLRKPPPEGSWMPIDYSPEELAEVLPQGFLDRTAGMGRVIGWAPQAQVLAHKATGGFVSHCGWNSTLESIHFGVPIGTWPLRAEQQTNAFGLVRELKLGVEISLDYRIDIAKGVDCQKVLSAEIIERGIRSLLEKDGEVRKRLKEMSDKSSSTKEQGGRSYYHLGRFIHSIMDRI